jgi:ribosomal protein S18 acetylase RimI-like enzyme
MKIIKLTAKNTDAHRVATLFNSVYIPDDFMATDIPVTPEYITQIVNKETCVLHIAVDDTDMYIGFILIYTKLTPEFAHRAYIQALAVIPNAHGKGVGQQLLETTFRWCREKGIQLITLEVVNANQPATELYERCGMNMVGQIPNGFYKNGIKYTISIYAIEI